MITAIPGKKSSPIFLSDATDEARATEAWKKQEPHERELQQHPGNYAP